jgi:hypothetical protein
MTMRASTPVGIVAVGGDRGEPGALGHGVGDAGRVDVGVDERVAGGRALVARESDATGEGAGSSSGDNEPLERALVGRHEIERDIGGDLGVDAAGDELGAGAGDLETDLVVLGLASGERRPRRGDVVPDAPGGVEVERLAMGEDRVAAGDVERGRVGRAAAGDGATDHLVIGGVQ